MFYVYLHIMVDTKEPFYVGKGKGNRSHTSHGRNKFWHNVVNKHGVEIKIIEENLTEEQAILLEQKLIAKYGRRDLGTGLLVNLTDGGEGVSGKIYTDEEKKLLSQKIKAHYNLPEAREKRKQVSKEVNSRPDVKEKLRMHALRINSNEEFKKIKSENTKNSWKNDETRQLRIKKIKQVRGSEESRNKSALLSQKTYVGFVSPTGKIYTPVINLKNFCKVHNLIPSCMYSVNSGKMQQHRGWKKYNPLDNK